MGPHRFALALVAAVLALWLGALALVARAPAARGERVHLAGPTLPACHVGR